eukprot:GHVS01041399.1.p1 GENE.GHVS01041399.1~~GHVS01041399.1.p1  ORF type:complete len:260 (+),score=50.79 GHVS01041399.1:219-998(+)
MTLCSLCLLAVFSSLELFSLLNSVYVSALLTMCTSAAADMNSSPSSPSPSHHYIFVYGTLKRGFRNHYNMDRIQYACSGVTVDKLPLYMDAQQRNRPCLANVKGVGHHVRGEVYRVTQQQLEELDVFERVPTHYHRELLPLLIDAGCAGEESGSVLEAYVYFINLKEEVKQSLREDERVQLIKDYTFAHHKIYLSRKEVEQIGKDKRGVTEEEEECQRSGGEPLRRLGSFSEGGCSCRSAGLESRSTRSWSEGTVLPCC